MNESPWEVISSRSNPLVKAALRLASSAAARREESLFICDGYTLLTEALRREARIVTVFCSRDMVLPPLPAGVRRVWLPEGLLSAVSSTDTPRGPVFICRRTPPAWRGFGQLGIYLLLDRIQDPGNVGSVLRTADAFEAAGVLLAPGCADPYSPKATRASMGAVFGRGFHVWDSDGEACMHDLLVSCKLPLIACVPGGDAVDVRCVDISSGAVLLLGNEGSGLSEAMLGLAGTRARIPMNPSCQSLGVAAAAAVLLWETYRGGTVFD